MPRGEVVELSFVGDPLTMDSMIFLTKRKKLLVQFIKNA